MEDDGEKGGAMSLRTRAFVLRTAPVPVTAVPASIAIAKGEDQ